ncbi:O-antigen ligase family protein [Halomonas sp. M20]|uniref:O-antigen ligase family protein n=1 Tax=Halomonas sp. M20 TaxID=2763264 RepID=UPI001D09CB9A|nr:O-antigen ligase family protein [Halomonas sp. M20]
MIRYTSLAVFLLGAVALVLPLGYFVGPALLVAGSVLLPILRSGSALSRQEWAIIGTLLFYAGVSILGFWLDRQSPALVESSIYVFLAIPSLLLLLAFPPSAAAMWIGMALGSLLTGGWASWQTLIDGKRRASGFGSVDAIQFGDLSLLLGFFCLAGLGWALSRSTRSGRLAWCILLVIGAASGILGSFLSGSRGGWLCFPFMLGVLYLGYGQHLSRRWLMGLAIFFLVGPVAAYAIPHLGVQERVQRIFSSYAEFAEKGDATNSVGARLEMWRSALILIPERPLLGWGESDYLQARDELIEKGTIHPYLEKFDHVHNDVLDGWLKRGIGGLASLLALYLVPLFLFARRLRSPDIRLRAFAIAGAALPVAYMGFGVTQTFLAFDSGIVMYVSWLTVLWSVLRARERRCKSNDV